MISRSVELANAIVTRLNEEGSGFTVQFRAERKAAPLTEVELEQSGDVHVLVFTGSVKSERSTRKAQQQSYLPIVGVQKHLRGATDQENEQEIDTLQYLVEQIHDALADADFVFDDWSASFVGFEQDQYTDTYSAEAMRTMNFFASATELEYTSG